ncbi:MAG: hypothetical protein HYY22_05930 [Thaumarchaeota archaeon]|nr:hypothetical protein [Nitrososphaerota archaeon]
MKTFAPSNVGLTITGISGDVYTNAVDPAAVTVFVWKNWDGLTKKSMKY